MSEHTKAAMRCAEAVIWRDGHHNPHPVTTGEKLAAIIDRETGLPELVEALQHFVSSAESWKWELNAIGCKECLHDARNALRKAGEL